MAALVRRNSSGKLIPTIMVTPIPDDLADHHSSAGGSNGSRSSNGGGEPKADYYAAGNKELATETALSVQRLEPVS